MRRVSTSGRLLRKSPIIDKEVIAIRDIDGEDMLFSKLRARKNVRRGAILTRPCFRSGNIIAVTGLCPDDDFSPAVSRATNVGSFHFDGIRRKNSNRSLKPSLASLEVIDPTRFAMRGFHLWRIVQIERPGPTLSVILSFGGWAAECFKSYLLFQEDGEAVSKSLLIEIDTGMGSADEYSSPYDDQCI